MLTMILLPKFVVYIFIFLYKHFVVHLVELIKNVLHPINVHVLVDGLDPIAIYVCWL